MAENQVATPVRIVFVITELEVGGAERCLTNLVLGLDRAKFAPTVIALKSRPVASQQALVEQLEEAGVPVHFMNLRSAFSSFMALLRLKRLFRKDQTDVVQTFLFHANVLGTIAARWAGVRRIICGIRVADPSVWRMTIERFSIRRADNVVCVSQAVADFMVTKVRVPISKLTVISNGIEIKALPEQQTTSRDVDGLPEGRLMLLAVGRLHRQKGFDWLLGLAPDLLKRLPEHDLVIVGDGPERESLTSLAAELEIDKRVHFLGWRSDVPDLMQASDQFLLTSRWEGMPNALIEAMALGLPVVATAAEGVHEVLGPLAEHQAVPFGDSEAMIAAVCQIASDSHLRASLERDNRSRIRERFSLASMITQYEDLYTVQRPAATLLVSVLPNDQ